MATYILTDSRRRQQTQGKAAGLAMTNPNPKRHYKAQRICRRCEESFGNEPDEDYRNCPKCREVINHAATGSMVAGKFFN